MKDKYNVEQYLNKLMPKTNVQIFERLSDFEKHITKEEEPNVKGWFKLIRVRYIRRVKDIKKLCVEYINTYIDGSLNVAEKMDDIKLAEARDSLAKDIKFQLEGFSTGGNTKGAQTKTGVAFLIGDKALKDKLNAILAKIELRASKSPILKNWADLMVLESKVIATNKLYELTNDMIDDETYKLPKKDIEDFIDDNEHKNEEIQRDNEDLTKELTKLIEKFGERDIWFKHGSNIESDKLRSEEYVPKISNNDSKEKENKVNEARKKFYDVVKSPDLDKIEKEIDDEIKKEINKGAMLIEDELYLRACLAIEKTKHDGSYVASPIDIVIAMANTESAQKAFGGNDTSIKDEKELLERCELKGITQNNDKDFGFDCVYLYKTMFSIKIGESFHIMTPYEFINEQLFNTYMEMKDMELAIMDVLDECDGGCLYIGNFPLIKENEVDYIMLDGNGGFGFYKENGNLDMALAMGEPQEVSPVEFNDGQKKAMMSTVLDFISEDVFKNLK